MFEGAKDQLSQELDAIRDAGLYKDERIIVSDQAAKIEVSTGESVLNFCANNYLGLSNNPELIGAAKDAMDQYGFGLSSVRFICGTQDQHKRLEDAVSTFLGTEDTILYTSCFDANAGLFETILGQRTPSSPMRSTTPRSSTAFVCARPSACASLIWTWRTWRPSSGRHRRPGVPRS